MYYSIFSCNRTSELYAKHKERFELFTPLERTQTLEGNVSVTPILYGIMYVPEHLARTFYREVSDKFFLQQWLKPNAKPRLVSIAEALQMQELLNQEWASVLQRRKPGRKNPTVATEDPHPFSIGDQVQVTLHGYLISGRIARLKSDGRVRIDRGGHFLDVPHTIVQFRGLQS